MKFNSRSAALAVTLATTVLSTTGSFAADLVTWDIPVSAASPSAGSTAGTPTLLTGVAAASGFTLTGSVTGTVSTAGWRWFDGSGPATDLATALAQNNFFAFNATASNVYNLTINGLGPANFSKGGTAPNTLALLYSPDDTWTPGNFRTISAAVTVPATQTNIGPSLAGDLSTTPITLNSGSTGYFRLVYWGATTTTSGTIFYGNSVSGNDFSLTGTANASSVVRNLAWTGTGGNNWNTTPTNTNWADTGNGNAASPFASNDNVSINIPASISVDAAGVTAGNVAIGNATGNVGLSGGNVSGIVLTKTAAGTASLGGSNSFSGGVSLTGGPLLIDSNDAVGGNTVSINGGTLATTVNATTVANTFSLGTAGSTLSTAGDVTFSGQLNTLGAATNASSILTKSGAGILTFTRTGSSALGNQMSFNTTGGAVELDITAGGVIFSGTGQRNLGGTNTWNGPVTLAGGTLMLHGGAVNGTGAVSVSVNSTISSRLNFSTANFSNPISVASGISLSLDSANGTNALAVSGVVSGEGGITKTGNGVVRIEGANSYTGVTTVSAGILRIGTGVVGTLGSGNVILAGGTLQLNREDNVTIPNLISGTGNVTGSSLDHTATLSAANTYIGITTVTEGRLGAALLGNGGLPSSIGQSTSDAVNLVFNGGSLSYSGAGPASTDRDFTLGINGGGPSATDAGAITYTSTNPITLAGQVPDTTASVSSTPTITALIVGTRYQIVTVGDTDFTLIGAASNTIGTAFTATGPGVGTGTVVSGLTVGTTYRIVAPGTTDFTLLGAANNLANTVFVATASGFNAGSGTIAYANGNFRPFRLGGSGTGNNSIAASVADGPADPNIFNPNKTSFAKNGTSTWITTGVHTYTGPTAVNGGILRLDGVSPATTGAVAVVSGGSLGGNGLTGGAVTLSSGGGLAAKISNWTGSAGTGYDDLAVTSLTISGPMAVAIDTTGLTNFTESVKSFTVLNTSGGITGFNPANVTFTSTGFAGSGTWSLAQSGNSLVLSYAPAVVTDPYQAWATGAPYNLAGVDASPTADPDKDGISNSVEFVIGGNPAGASNTGLLPTLVVDTNNFTITFRLSDLSAYLNPTVQYGSNLSGWTTALNGVNGVTIGAPTVLETGIKQVVVTIPKTLAVGSRLFGRLNVVVP